VLPNESVEVALTFEPFSLAFAGMSKTVSIGVNCSQSGMKAWNRECKHRKGSPLHGLSAGGREPSFRRSLYNELLILMVFIYVFIINDNRGSEHTTAERMEMYRKASQTMHPQQQ
jgi:hypothetical protein